MNFNYRHPGHSPIPADGGPGSGNTPDPYQWQGGARQGGGGGHADPLDSIEAYEWLRRHDAAIPYGSTHRNNTVFQEQRIQQWRDKTGWDGDLRWAPPGFLHDEEQRGLRLDRQQGQAEALAYQAHRTQMAQLQRDEAAARMSEKSAYQNSQQGTYPPAPWRR